MTDRKDLSSKEIDAKASKKARLAQILERGVVLDRLSIPVEELEKEGKVGQWVRERDEDIQRMEALGFEVFQGETGKGMHGTADSRNRVGDSILMYTSQENWDILQELNAERRKKRSVKKAKAEYVRMARTQPAGIQPLGNVDNDTLTEFDDPSVVSSEVIE